MKRMILTSMIFLCMVNPLFAENDSPLDLKAKIYESYINKLSDEYLTGKKGKVLISKIKIELADKKFSSAVLFLAEGLLINDIKDTTDVKVKCSTEEIKAGTFNEIKNKYKDRLDDSLVMDSYKIYKNLDISIREDILSDPGRFPLAPDIFDWGGAAYLTYGKKIILATILSQMDYCDRNLMVVQKKVEVEIVSILNEVFQKEGSNFSLKREADVKKIKQLENNFKEIEAKLTPFIEMENVDMKNPFTSSVGQNRINMLKKEISHLNKMREELEKIAISSSKEEALKKKIGDLIGNLTEALKWEEKKIEINSDKISGSNFSLKNKDDFTYELESKPLYLKVKIKNSIGYLKREEKIYGVRQGNFINILDNLGAPFKHLILAYIFSGALIYEIISPSKTLKKVILDKDISSLEEIGAIFRKIDGRVKLEWKRDEKVNTVYMER